MGATVRIMISHFIFTAILVIAITFIGYRYFANVVKKQKDVLSSQTINICVGLPVLQLGLWSLMAFGFWAFLPVWPSEDNGIQFYNSVFADTYISEETFSGLYELKTANFIQLLIFGGLASLVIYTLVYNNHTISQKAVKVLTCINTIFSTILAWCFITIILAGTLYIMLDGKLHPAVVIALYIIVAIFVIRYAIKLQKLFNRSVPQLISSLHTAGSTATGATKQCPYCGETILAVAKKCKHCGEWIKEEDEIKKVIMMDCPICSEQIDASATVCPICHEPLPADHSTHLAAEPRNAFHEKVKAEKAGAQSQEPRISNYVIYNILFCIFILGMVFWLIND